MFDLKKTILLTLVVMAVTVTAIAGYVVGNHVGYIKGYCDADMRQNNTIIKQDSLLRMQTETCHKLMDAWYENFRQK